MSRHRNFREVSVHVSFQTSSLCLDGRPDFRGTAEEETRRQWMDLDRVLDQLCESRGIGAMVWYHPTGVLGETITEIGDLFPRMMKRGSIGMVDRDRFPV